jgi:acetolactate synthase-1/2/3 large subunit
MGVIGVATGGPRLLPDADCVVMAGAVSDYRLGYLETPAKVVWMTRGWSELARELTASSAHAAWLAEAQQRLAAHRRAIRETGEQQARQGTHAIHVMDALGEVMTEKTLLLIDGGSIGQWAHQLLADRYPARWLTCGRSGVVGWGLGGAMAARVVYPDAPVILLSGDGAFTFTVAEIECAVRQKLPFVAIVVDDLGWGITRTGHLRQFGEAISSSLGPIAFDRLAQSLGACGTVARSPGEIAPAIRQAIDSGVVTVIHVPVVGGNPS